MKLTQQEIQTSQYPKSKLKSKIVELLNKIDSEKQ